MSKPTTADTSAQDKAWWRHALAEANLGGQRWLRKHYPAIRHLHDDLIGETSVQVTEYLLHRSPKLPPSWFQPETPPATDISRFHGFVLTVLKRRVMDQFRSDFRHWTHSLAPEEPGNEVQSATPDEASHLDRELDVRRTAKALMTILANLSEENRLLMEEVALGGRDQPYDASQRQRVKRLRRQLLQELTAALGHDPLKLL